MEGQVKEQSKKKMDKKVVIGVAAVVLVLVVILVIVLCSGKKNEKGDNDKTTTAGSLNVAQKEKVVCEKMMSTNEFITMYLVYEINAKDGRTLSYQAYTKRTYASKEDYNALKEMDADRKEITYDDATLSSMEKYEELKDLTKDAEGNELEMPVQDYVNSLAEQEYICK